MPLLFGKKVEFGSPTNTAMIAENVTFNISSEEAWLADENGRDIGYAIYNEKATWTASGNPLMFEENETPVKFPVGSEAFPLGTVYQDLWSTTPAATTTVVNSGGKTRARGAFATAEVGGVVLAFGEVTPASSSGSQPVATSEEDLG